MEQINTAKRQGNGLQKFTDTYVLQKKKLIPEDYRMNDECDSWAITILFGEKWTSERLKGMTPEESQMFRANATNALNCLAFEDRDRLMDRLDGMLDSNTRKAIWGHNHSSILAAINNLTEEFSRFPTRTEISQKTFLSRVTINKHLKEYFGSDEYKERKEELIVMRDSILAKAFKFGLQGDVRAIKIFLDATSEAGASPRAVNNHQTNYIQVNGFVITEDHIRNLPIEKLDKIHEIINESIEDQTIKNN